MGSYVALVIFKNLLISAAVLLSARFVQDGKVSLNFLGYEHVFGSGLVLFLSLIALVVFVLAISGLILVFAFSYVKGG